jgi:uncharacterized membrane protein
MRHITLAVFCLVASPPLLAADYSFVSINVPGGDYTEAHGINERGDIVGLYYTAADGVSHGFLLRKGVFTTIDVPGAAETLGARGINSRGDIVGGFTDSAFVLHGYLLSDGRFTQIDVPGASGNGASRINDAGDVMGHYFDAVGNHRGYIRKDGKFSDVRVPGGTTVTVRDAQDNGRVLVGTVILNQDGGFHGFRRSRAGELELIEYPGLSVPCSGLRSINQRGDIVGGFAYVNSVDECYPPFVDSHGFLLRDGQFTVIDFPGSQTSTEPTSINDDGVIVGRYVDRGGAIRGFKAKPNSN